MGSPLFWRYGMGLKTSNVAFDLRLMASNKSLMVSEKTVCPIDKNTKLTFSA